MASHDEALLAEIRAAPDDDAPRLVFADALSDRGDPWGELIVAGCELARLARAGTAEGGRLRELEGRCRAIRQQRWRDRSMRFDATVERGFCRSVNLSNDEVTQLEGYEFAVLQELRQWVSRPAGLRALAEWPGLDRLERLLLRGPRRERAWEAPADGDRGTTALDLIAERARPSSLELNEINLGDGLATLVRSSLRASLRRLAIVRGMWPSDFVELDWPALDALVLIELGLTGSELARLLRHPALGSLTVLSLSNNPIGDVGMRVIAERGLANLRALRIEQTYMGPNGMTALARSSLVRRLTSLAIGDDHSNPTSAALCRVAEAAEQLVELEIDQRFISSVGAVEIVRRLRAPLRSLRLRMGDDGFAMVTALLNNRALRGLRRLDLSNQPISHAAVVALARAELDSLEWLDLSTCRLEPESAYALARSPTLPRRLAIRLQGNARGPDSVTEPLVERFSDVRF